MFTMTTFQGTFKSWVPRWLMIVGILLTLSPLGAVLGIYLGGISSAMSYYGADSFDIRYSVVIYYLAIACAFPLEKRFFNYFATKPYLVGSYILFIIINLILYYTHSIAVLFVLRFLGGMLSLAFIGILFTLVFQQFHSQRSRVLGYATLYSLLLSSAPLSYVIDAFVFTKLNFNVIFLLEIFISLPGIILLCICLKDKADLRAAKMPFKNIDWASFVLYASSFLAIAYVLMYGQYYGWYTSVRIIGVSLLAASCFILFILRQITLKEPYIDLGVYKHRNFRIGMLLLIAFYFSKGDTSVSFGFLTNSVNLDSYHQSYVMLINGFGILAGAGLAARFILTNTRIRLIWLTGFASLLIYHIYMLYLIGNQAETTDVLIPLFFQGFGNGILMLSIVIFYATGVPAEVGFSASVTGVSYRFLTFTASMALVSFMGLRQQSIHYNAVAENIQTTNSFSNQRLQTYEQLLQSNGTSKLQAHYGANRLLGTAVKKQTDLLYARDYYQYMSAFIILVMLAIALIPHFHYHLRKIGDKLIPI